MRLISILENRELALEKQAMKNHILFVGAWNVFPWGSPQGIATDTHPGSRRSTFPACSPIPRSHHHGANGSRSVGARQTLVSITRVLLVAKRGGQRISEFYARMFSPYSNHVASAIEIFSTLSSFPKSAPPADQVFFDRLMASALRHTAEGMRLSGVGMGARQDTQGLALCANFVSSLARRTSAPFACETAAAVIGVERGMAGDLAVLNAAAAALTERVG